MKERVTADREGNKIKTYELLFPDDFNLSTAPDLQFNHDFTEFTIGNLLHKDLRRLREAQLGDDSTEHGLLRIMHKGKYYVVNKVLEGLNCEIRWQIGYGSWSEDYHRKSVFEWQPTPIIESLTDFSHTHPSGENVDLKTSGLFSADDIISMGRSKAERHWVIGPDGTVWCLINPYPARGRSDFDEAGYRYKYWSERYRYEHRSENRSRMTYEEVYQHLIECVKECSLRLYKSNNLKDFIAST